MRSPDRTLARFLNLAPDLRHSSAIIMYRYMQASNLVCYFGHADSVLAIA